MKIMRFLFLTVILIFISSYSFAAVCSVKAACLSSEISIFSVASATNAHASSLTTGSGSYELKVCCPSTVSGQRIIGNTCGSPNSTIAFKLSSQTNAHAEQATENNYTANVCISGSVRPACRYVTTGLCPANELGLARISSSTNAHVEEFSQANYPIQICCRLSGAALAVVSIQGLDIIAAETSANPRNNARVRVSRTGSLSSPLSVNYTVSGNAQNGVDYTLISGTANIAANSQSANIDIIPLDDLIIEGTEKITIKLSDSENYILANPSEVTVNLLDNDLGVNQTLVSIAATDMEAKEINNDEGAFTITRTDPLDNPLTVIFSISGTAKNTEDYLTIDTSTVIAANVASTTIPIIPINDTIDEIDETVSLTIESDNAYNVSPQFTDTLTILDDDGPGTVASTCVPALGVCKAACSPDEVESVGLTCDIQTDKCCFPQDLQDSFVNLVGVKIIPLPESKTNYTKNPPEQITFEISIDKKHTALESANFIITKTIEGEYTTTIEPNGFTSFADDPYITHITVDADSLSQGSYTFSAIITGTKTNDALIKEQTTSDNISNTSVVVIEKNTTRIPDFPPIFAIFIAFIVIIILPRRK